MRFTVCTITKDRPGDLQRCMESVRRQTFQDWEHVIVDGSLWPSPATSDYPRVRHYRRKPAGIVTALNEAIALAEGEIVTCLHDDDELVSDALALVDAAFTRQPEAQWLCARTRWLDEQGETMFERGGTEIDLRRTMAATMSMGAAVFWRRGFAERAGGLDERFDAAHDFDLYRRMARLSPPILLPAVLYLYHDHPGTYSRVHRERQRAQLRQIASL